MSKNLKDYIDLWDQIQKNENKSTKKEGSKIPLAKGDSTKDLYWNNIYSNDLLQEVIEKEGEHSPNPIAGFSFGKDQDGHKPDWVDNPLLKDLEELKLKLHDIENKFLSGEQKDAFDTKEQKGGESFSQEIESLKKKIDELSDKIVHTKCDVKKPESL